MKTKLQFSLAFLLIALTASAIIFAIYFRPVPSPMDSLPKNSVLHEDVTYRIDPEESEIIAYFNPSTNDLTWVVMIAADAVSPVDCDQSANLEGPPLEFKNFDTFSALKQQEFSISYPPGEVHPILPDNPGNFYMGVHAFPNSNELKFSRVGNATFKLLWRFNAEMYEGDESPTYVKTELSVKELVIWKDSPISLEDAESVIEKKFSCLPIASEQAEENLVKFRVDAG